MSIRGMMKLKHKQIYLFDTLQATCKQNSLKEFIYFLRFNGVKGIIDFSYAAAQETIHPTLSIKDNFILDSVPTSLIKNKEDNLNERISKLNNKLLIELINKLGAIDRKADQLTKEEQKLSSIVKALLSSSEYVFLEMPESGLGPFTLKKLKECLLFEVETNERTIFIHAKNNNSWLDITSEIVTKQKNGKYQHSKNPLLINHQKNQKNQNSDIKDTNINNVHKLPTPNESTYNFTLFKKVS